MEIELEDGIYKAKDTIGQGFYGEVKLLVHTRTERQLALKIIDSTLSETALDDAESEAEILKELSVNPMILQYVHHLQCGDQFFLITEYIEEGTLSLYIGSLTTQDAIRIYKQILSSLEFIHGKGICHRDIKPTNIMLTKQGMIKLIDFGLAERFIDENGKEVMLNYCQGYSGYLPPEVQAKKECHGPSHDIWSSGIVFVESITGKSPWKRANPAEDENYRAWKSNNVTSFWNPIGPELISLLRKVLSESVIRPSARDILDWFEETVKQEMEEGSGQTKMRSTMLSATDDFEHTSVYPMDVESFRLRELISYAKKYEFKLDEFQKRAIQCINNDQSVLVASHTSTGKTAIALYAVAHALRENKRIIYTTPIKALSNQKYRELAEEFCDVGLITGDITLNPGAACVVMTTEILRTALYEGSALVQNLGWVVFDEIHYMRNAERGVVWEESIVLLPEECRMVFLSATMPNALQFGHWIAAVKNQHCNVICTIQRPVPLQHLLCPIAPADCHINNALWEVVDIRGRFNAENFARAMQQLERSGGQQNGTANGGVRQQQTKRAREQQRGGILVHILRTLRERDALPCIAFTFSRKDCEAYAVEMKNMDFNTEAQKRTVRMLFKEAIDHLSEEDKKLPSLRLLPYLLRGIGIHHSGQLPLMRELVEILFGEGLLKVLFATETFAMGVNMPARSVLFTSARKFDGAEHRWLTSAEYIQMSGRAGRRGKDQKGLVVMMVDQQMSAETAKHVIMGACDQLDSQFRLSYNMILNLLNLGDSLRPEVLLQKSFKGKQNRDRKPALLKDKHEKMGAWVKSRLPNETDLANFHKLAEEIAKKDDELKKLVLKQTKVVPFFQPGRLIKLQCGDKNFDWGVLIDWDQHRNPMRSNELLYVVMAAVFVERDCERNLHNMGSVYPPPTGDRGTLVVLPFAFDCIKAISRCRLKLPEDLKAKEGREALATYIEKTKLRFRQIPELHPVSEMGCTETEVGKIQKELEELHTKYEEHPLKSKGDFGEMYDKYKRKRELEEAYKRAENALVETENAELKKELGIRKKVLAQLGYTEEDGAIAEKGRIASKISTGDELMLTEMLCAGAFDAPSPSEVAALLSCFVFQERFPVGQLSDTLKGLLANLRSCAGKLAKTYKNNGLDVDEHKYVEQFCPGMMEITFSWCEGSNFAKISEKTEIFEGSIVRCFRRLNVLLSEMINAANVWKKELVEKFETAREKLRRDIPFASSLYV